MSLSPNKVLQCDVLAFGEAAPEHRRWTSQMRHLLALAICISASTASAEGCPPPPVKDESHAICLAQQYAKHSNPWELTFEAQEQPKEWLVSYAPKSSGIRGGAGDLKIEKESGKVIVVKLYR